MSNPPQLDDETLAFAERVFDLARQSDAAEMAGPLDHGLPPNMRNDNCDGLLVLAAARPRCWRRSSGGRRLDLSRPATDGPT